MSEFAHDNLIASTDTIDETKAQVDSEAINAYFLIAHVYQIAFDSEIDNHAGLTNILALINLYAVCHVSDVAAHNIHLQIATVHHCCNKPRQA